jgi:hypothetical protein
MAKFKMTPDAELKVGDVVRILGTERRILRIEPYRGPLMTCIGLVTTDIGPGFSLWQGTETERLVLE